MKVDLVSWTAYFAGRLTRSGNSVHHVVAVMSSAY